MGRGSTRTCGSLTALLWLCLSFVQVAVSANIAYCSRENTASDVEAAPHDYQSHGWCTDHCTKTGAPYAFAVINRKDCWCSYYIPEDQQSPSECSSPCPGFPDEKCGNYDQDYFAYVPLDAAPSGTKGTVTSTTTDSRTSSPTEFPSTLPRITSTDKPAPPETSIRIITQSHEIITQTVVTTPSPVPGREPSPKSSSSTGAIVGGVVGGIVGLAAVVGAIFLLLRRRRRLQTVECDGQGGVQRNTSTLSKAGLLQTSERLPFSPPITTGFNKRQSRNMDQESVSPISASDRRHSRPMVDQRLNPSTVFVLDNSSRGSLGSMDDSRDYHRPLNVRNPDP